MRIRFKIRTLMVAVLIAAMAIGLVILSVRTERERRRAEVAEALLRAERDMARFAQARAELLAIRGQALLLKSAPNSEEARKPVERPKREE
jgi:hypothetical protein